MNQAQRIDAVAARWLARQDAGDWSDDDQQALDAWLNEATAHRVAWLRLRSVWQRLDGLRAAPDNPMATETALHQGQMGTYAPQRATALRLGMHRSRRTWFAMLGVACVAVTAAWLQLQTPARLESFSTPVGGREAISLADGSRLTLNTNTRARARINAQERRVWLDAGEALFEVRYDPARPFVVNAGAQQITVLGTKFRVRVEGARTEVTVVEGRVALENQRFPALAQALGTVTGGDPPTYETVAQLSGNDAAVVQGSSVLLQVKSTQEVANELVWREGLLVFDQRTLAEIAAEFNRYNQTQLLIDPSAAELRLGGSFEARNLASFVRLVQDGFGLKVSQQGQQGQQIRLSR